MKLVKEGKIIKQRLPHMGIIEGATVMNFHLLPQQSLIAEGWLPVQKVEPDYNNASEQLVFDRYEILATKVKEIYVVQPIPEPTPDPMQVLSDRVGELEWTKDVLIEKAIITEEDLVKDEPATKE